MKTKLKPAVLLMFLSAGNAAIAQDTLIKQNNEIVIAKIVEISSTEVMYNRFDAKGGPVYTVNKSEIKMIKYSNGMKDDFQQGQARKENPGADQKAEVPADTSTRYILTLLDGTQLRGKIIKQTKTELVFSDNNLGEQTIKTTNVKSLKPQFGEETMVFTMQDGSIITGKILNRTESYTVVETKNFGAVSLPASNIKKVDVFDEGSITKAGKIWFKNPNCTRYLFAPSAIPLKKGEGYYQNIYGAINAVNFGLTDNISIGIGGAGPAVIYLNTKIGFKVANNIHVAAGILAGNVMNPFASDNGNNDNAGIALGFGVVTLGNYDHNITFGGGYGYANNNGVAKWQKKPLFIANGMARLGCKYALVTENWIVPVNGDILGIEPAPENHYDVVFSYAFRYMKQRSTLDVGFINTPELVEKGWLIGIPYIGFVVRFGKYKDN